MIIKNVIYSQFIHAILQNLHITTMMCMLASTRAPAYISCTRMRCVVYVNLHYSADYYSRAILPSVRLRVSEYLKCNFQVLHKTKLILKFYKYPAYIH